MIERKRCKCTHYEGELRSKRIAVSIAWGLRTTAAAANVLIICTRLSSCQALLIKRRHCARKSLCRVNISAHYWPLDCRLSVWHSPVTFYGANHLITNRETWPRNRHATQLLVECDIERAIWFIRKHLHGPRTHNLCINFNIHSSLIESSLFSIYQFKRISFVFIILQS